MTNKTSSVFVSIVGRPNAGKSSLLNRLVGEKVAIVTPKPQTTRTRITGIVTRGPVQYVFLDTPGMHRPRTKLGSHMTKTVKDTLSDGDVVLMLFDPFVAINEAEEQLMQDIKNAKEPAFAAINKTDVFAEPDKLESLKKKLEETGIFNKVFCISAATGAGCDELMDELGKCAVEGPHFFSEDAFTDMPEKQLVAEIIREKLLLNLQQEIPHGTAVEIERFHEREDKPIVEIDATIYCDKKSHKGMIIGKNGQMLKTIASQARQECEELLGTKVQLQCWVKVKEKWRDNEYWLNQLGFKK